ncbi:SCO family protein [Aliifodinibius salipaludis]|uniref:SCO family protein n=1 Tax=Fodinibius salipaludis TaxID=2032627 RepID=A0A2A2G846_9BACT|nr:SCO family protein [Aliifodinibius salipaludis]PAU93468.1 SCO family protein [Aliifodinibius salipaludis]
MKHLGLVITVISLFLLPYASKAQLNKQKPKQLEDVGVEERLGEQVPLDLTFANAKGDSIKLKDLFTDGKPVLLNPVYYECPQLCSMIKEAIFKGVKDLKWSPGKEYNIVTFSFDPSETTALAAENRERFLNKLGRKSAGKGWHFLTGTKENIDKLTEAVGFNKRRLQDGQYAHGAAIMFLSPDGVITRYLYGLKFDEFNLRNALYDAADGNIGSAAEQVLLYCYQYDADSNTYVPVAWKIMQVGGFATMLILGIFLGFMWLRHRYSNNEKQIKETNGRD